MITKILPNILVVQGRDFCQGSRDVLIRNNLTKYWTGVLGCTDQNTVMEPTKINLEWHWGGGNHKGKPCARIKLASYL